jgi:hypothetical protein
MTQSTITITDPGDGSDLDVRLEFHPNAKTKGPMTPDQALAMAALKAIKDYNPNHAED